MGLYRHALTLCLVSVQILCLSFVAYGQETFTLSGKVYDGLNQEPLIGATIVIGESGTVTDFDGNYSVELKSGSYNVVFSYVGYQQTTEEVNITKNMLLDVSMNNTVMQEVLVTADIAMDRKTPVAFSNVPTKRIDEELSSQDLPLLLNTTPGVYATQQGGGDGDARVSIRGFSQNNIAVMLDGVPVNDMENGAVFWSNWFGLDMITQTMQVQRGLGASKLSIPAVGGTINILTKGIGAKKQLRLKQEIANDNFYRTSLGFTSGRLKNDFGVSGAFSYKKGDGWVNGNFTEGFFYYLKLEKQFGKHLISLSGFGAPQEHGQRSFQMAMATIDTAYAKEQGVPDEFIYGPSGNIFAWNQNGLNRGRKYNQHTGFRSGELQNTRINEYHKPQFTLRHSFDIDQKSFLSNVLYLSIGRGGGIRDAGENWARYLLPENGIYDLDSVYRSNQSTNIFRPEPFSEEYLSIAKNEHFWYGLLSTYERTLSEHFTLSGGLDLRYYRGDHFTEVYDLLGGDFVTFNANEGNARVDVRNTRSTEGDIIQRNWSGFVGWGGLFSLLEYSDDRWSAFLNLSAARLSYSAEDYFIAKEVNLADTSFLVSYGDTVVVGEEEYHLNSPEAKDQRVDWIHLPTYTVKLGASYKINKNYSVFSNLGYFSKPPLLQNVINNSTTRNPNAFGERAFYDNEEIRAIELGMKYSSRKLAWNLNAYRTEWMNRPFRNVITTLEDPTDAESRRVPLNISGVDAKHIGVEVDFAYKVRSNLTVEGLVSYGDWIWNSEESAEFYITTSGVPTLDTFTFDARGVHVGDAAQSQYGLMVRWEPVRRTYLKARYTYFDRHYSNFQPEDLKGENGGRDVYQTPSYGLLDLHAGLSFKLNKIGLQLRGSVLNALDEFYISDANVNNTFTPGINTEDFDAKSTSVHFGQGRRWNISLTITL